MSYCKECGSEVAESDLFCPFCGISMKPVEVAGVSADAFEHTVVMSAPQIEVSTGIEPSETPESEDAAVEEPAEAISMDEPVADEQPSPPTTADLEDEEVAPQPETPAILQQAAEELSSGAIIDEPAIEEPETAASDVVDETGPVEPAAEDISVAPADSEPETVEDQAQPEAVIIEEIMTEAAPVEEVHEAPVEYSSIEETVSETPDERIDFDLAPAVLPGEANEIPDETPETSQGDTSSGEIAGEKGSFTTPGLEGGTDGRRSGLKPLGEGTILNRRYQIIKKIGGGGMGAVYLAVDQNLGGTHRAVKEMVQSHIEEEQQAKAIEDFKRESMILSTLDHPSIPTIYDYFYDDAESRFYLVMKYISGGDLSSRLRAAPEGRIDERTVTEWAVQIIDVLHYLHSLPTTIVYRDLKPSNVMIDGNTGRIMLIDFGIARSINQTQEKGVTAVGTMGYAPPELFSGQVEPRSDIYSLGSTMFHLLTGADPQNNPLLIFDFQKNPRPRQINPRLSDQIERILMRSVEYNADARFSSALEMKVALQQHLDDLNTGRVSYGISEVPAAVSLANQNVFCGFCGQRIVATDLFCAFCGSKQPIAQRGVHSEIYSSRGGATARLVIEGTTDLDTPAYALEKNENLVGRRDPMSNIFPEVDLSKWDPQTKISRRHARIWRDGNAFLVEDLGSSNGTLLLTNVSDTLRLAPHKPHPLANGDRIRVGDTTLQFIVG